MWPIRILFARLRPLNATTIARTVVVLGLVAAFLWGDYLLFRRLFDAIADVERETPFFALGLLRNLLSLVFLVATVILFSSSLTTAIGSFFTDLDLDVYHAAPRSKLRIAIARWGKTLTQSAAVIFLFLIPPVIAFAEQYGRPAAFSVTILLNLALLLTIPVSLASIVIILLVRWFPVGRVHQIVATLAVIILTIVIIGFRMTRPERFFTEISTDDVARVLRSIELPSMSVYPSTSLAHLMTRDAAPGVAPRIAITAALLFAVFVAVARAAWFAAFVRARESLAPAAIGSAATTRFFDRLLAHSDPPLRALIGKEIRTVGRDVAQWSQVFLMAALLFIYLYNIRMLPLGGDARATLVAYANLGMTGFVIAAIGLRFAYPSVSTEGKAFWIVRTAPVSYRQFIRIKVLVYAAPLTLLAILLTAFANLLLDANAVVWAFTLTGATLVALTLVSFGVGLGAVAPNFKAENPLQVGISLGGFAYMTVSMAYVALMMVLMARPVMAYLLSNAFGLGRDELGSLVAAIPIAIALLVSAVVALLPLAVAERRLASAGEDE